MLKRIFITIVLLSIHLYNVNSEKAFYFDTTIFTQNDDYFLHTVERGQTVYSIAAMYRVSVEAIYNINPGSREGIKEGSQLKIPQVSGSYYYHTIQPKETLYSVSKKYQMKGEDVLMANPGLSVETFTIGKTIRIPTNMVTTPMESGNESVQKRETNALLYQTYIGDKVNTISIALLLPFGLKDGINSMNASNNRFVEYYEGFLMALEQAKKDGVSVDLQVFDIGNDVKDLTEILKKRSMQNVHLVVGGQTDKQIRMISGWAKEREIGYVIPFTSKNDEYTNNPYVFQINTPHSYLNSKVSEIFCKNYKDRNIIFFTSDVAKEESSLIGVLQADLKQRKIPFQKITYSKTFSENIKAALIDDRINVVIPCDDSAESLVKVMAPLKVISEDNPRYSIDLFGYPAWQVYSGEYLKDYSRMGTTIYSIFYADPTSSEFKTFYNNFTKWYSRDLINTFPKFGILGYDTGLFFIKAIHEYGTSFSLNVDKVKYKGIQTDFRFDRVNNWSGYINTNIYMITFNSDYTITKTSPK